jgi:hypothetical protein
LVQTQIRLMSSGGGATAEMTPRCVGFAESAEQYQPIVAGASHVLRAKSGRIFCQLLPPSAVFHTVFDAKYTRLTCCGPRDVQSTRCSSGGSYLV